VIVVFAVTTSEMFLPTTKFIPYYKNRHFTIIALFSAVVLLMGILFYQKFGY
jgi:hypothetical protein